MREWIKRELRALRPNDGTDWLILTCWSLAILTTVYFYAKAGDWQRLAIWLPLLLVLSGIAYALGRMSQR